MDKEQSTNKLHIGITGVEVTALSYYEEPAEFSFHFKTNANPEVLLEVITKFEKAVENLTEGF